MNKRLWWLLVALECAATAATAFVLLPTFYAVGRYRVESAPPAPVNYLVLLALAPLAASAGILAFRRGRESDWPRPLAKAWLPLLVNLLTVLDAVLRRPPGFLKPAEFAVSIALSTGLAILAGYVSRKRRTEDDGTASSAFAAAPEKTPANACAAIAAIAFTSAAAAVWMYAVQEHFLSQLAYGWPDSGLYYLRIKNTALGRGILQETLSKPPFYDHFDVALFLLVPFYWLFKSYRIIMWAQAICLAAVGPAVFVYARGRGFSPWTSFAFAAAALLHPSIGQMSYAFSYGFHPIIMAIAPCILSLHFWEKGRMWPFAVCALLAATTEQTVFPFYAGVGLVDFFFRRGQRLRAAVLMAISVALFLFIVRVVQPLFTGPTSYYHLLKFEHLGGSFSEILASPFTKPGEFWGLLFSKASLSYVTLLVCGMCLLPLCAPRQLLYPVIVLVFSLLMANPNLKIICYQYQSLVLAAWLPATVAGARRAQEWFAGSASGVSNRAFSTAVLTAAFIMSHFYGLLPWSRVTLPFPAVKDAEFASEAARIRDFAAGVLPPARVLATGRAAMLFCDAGDVTQLKEWDRKSTDYDVVVLQLGDDWGQSYDDCKLAHDTMAASGKFSLMPIGRFSVFIRGEPTSMTAP